MRRALLGLLPLLLHACTTEHIPAPQPPTGSPTIGGAQARVSFRLDPVNGFGLRVLDRKGTTLLDTMQDRDPHVAGGDAYATIGATHHDTQFQTTLIEGWDHVVGSDGPWAHTSKIARASFTATTASIDLVDPKDASAAVHLDVSVNGAEVRIDATASGGPASAPLNQMGMAFHIGEEHFFGFGERFVGEDQLGQRLESWTEEGGIGLGEGKPPGPSNPSPNGAGMTHLPVPFFISSAGYGLWMDTSYRTGFSLGADDPQVWRLYAEEPALHLRILVHDDPKDTLAHYTALTGRAQLPAPWVFGPRRRVDHGPLIEGVPEEEALRKHHVPTTMVDDTTHFLPVNGAAGQEAFLADWTARMHAWGYKAIGYFNAYVSLTDHKSDPLVAYGRAHDLFVRLDDGSEFDTFMVSAGGQTVATIDMTNPEAVAWFQSLEQQALDLGYDGWMLDFGEYLPQRALMHDGRTGWEMHNEFPLIYQRAAYDYLRRVRSDDFMFYARAGYAGTQAVSPVVWSGDPNASFAESKGLPANVRAGINAGVSGIPFWGSDISGYTCLNDPPPDEELYLRWAEFGALSSDMHDENACSQKPKDAPPKWTIWSSPETTAVYARYASLHTRLFPYIYATAKEATETGMPVIRHPFLMRPKDAAARATEGEYWFGPSLYVAPVVARGARTRELTLPSGTWFDWWTMEPRDGGAKVTREAPLDLIPIFLRSGGVVAMLDPSVETLAPATRTDVVTMESMASVLDVRAAIDVVTAQGSANLVDGTDLAVLLSKGAVTLPTSIAAASEEALATCSLCGRIDPLPSGALRVRITSDQAIDSAIAAGALLLRAGHAPRAKRYRWDVAVKPG